MRSFVVKSISGPWEAGEVLCPLLWRPGTCPASSPGWVLGMVNAGLENSVAQD